MVNQFLENVPFGQWGRDIVTGAAKEALGGLAYLVPGTQPFLGEGQFGPQMSQAGIAAPTSYPPPTAQAVPITAAGPVQFVKFWRAPRIPSGALFAMDNTGKRWVWKPTQNRWKAIRQTRNIIISGRDLRAAEKLVRVSARLNKVRHRMYSKNAAGRRK